ncbi:hypothetical protein GS883_21855 [Rhodococcus hoagii]|nr:hypothetical protein [Prescottella equi]
MNPPSGSPRRLADIARPRSWTIHAALAAVLARHNDTDDIVIGTAVAGRGDPRLDSLVGMFASTLPLRTDVAAGQAFADLLEHVRERDIEAFARVDTPFERIVERVAPERYSARHPIFQVALAVRRPGACDSPSRVSRSPRLRSSRRARSSTCTSP